MGYFKKIKNSQRKIIQIVAPTVWAWRSGRAKKFSRVFNEIFTLFNFERKFFEKEGLKSTFIGHPISIINESNYTNKEKNLIEKSIIMLEKRFTKKIVTYIRKFDEFYEAEEFHQDYYVENFINYLRYKKGCKRVKTLEKIWN